MVFGLNKRNPDSAETFESIESEDECDVGDHQMRRGRKRTDGENTARARRRSRSTARSIAGKVANFAKHRSEDGGASSLAMEPDNVSPTRRRFRSKTPDKRRNDHDEDGGDIVPMLPPISSDANDLDDIVNNIAPGTPPSSPGKSSKPRWRSPLRKREEKEKDNNKELTLDDLMVPKVNTEEDGNASGHGSVLASIASMFETKSKPMFGAEKLHDDEKELNLTASPSRSPRRFWRGLSPLKVRQHDDEESSVVSAPPLRPSMLAAPSMANVNNDYKKRPSMLAAPSMANVNNDKMSISPTSKTEDTGKDSDISPRKLSRFRRRSKTPECRNRVRADSLQDASKLSPTEDPTDLNCSDHASVLSEVIGSPTTGKSDERSSKKSGTLKNLFQNPFHKHAMEKSSSLRSLGSVKGILRSGSNRSLECAKYSGGTINNSNNQQHHHTSEGHDHGNMTLIPEGCETDLEASTDFDVASVVSSKSRKEQKKNNSSSSVQQTKKQAEPTSEKDERIVKRELFRSNSEKGTKSTSDEKKKNKDEMNVSQTIASLVSPRKRTDNKMRVPKGAIPAAPGLDSVLSKDSDREHGHRRRSSVSSSASRSRGRSNGAARRSSKVERSDSKSRVSSSKRSSTPSKNHRESSKSRSSRSKSRDPRKRSDSSSQHGSGEKSSSHHTKSTASSPSRRSRKSTDSVVSENTRPSSPTRRRRTIGDHNDGKTESAGGKVNRPSSPVRRRRTVGDSDGKVGHRSKTPSRTHQKVGVDPKGKTNPPNSNVHCTDHATETSTAQKKTKDDLMDMRRDLGSDPMIVRTISPTKNPRVRCKSVNRVYQIPQTPQRSPRRQSKLLSKSASLRSGLNPHSNSSLSKLKNKNSRSKETNDDDDGDHSVAQLHIPTFTNDSESVLRVEYCDASEVSVA